MSSSPPAGEAAAVPGLDLNFAAAAAGIHESLAATVEPDAVSSSLWDSEKVGESRVETLIYGGGDGEEKPAVVGITELDSIDFSGNESRESNLFAILEGDGNRREDGRSQKEEFVADDEPVVEMETEIVQLVNDDSTNGEDLVMDENLNCNGESVMEANLVPYVEAEVEDVDPVNENLLEREDFFTPNTSENEEKQTILCQEDDYVSSLVMNRELEVVSDSTLPDGSRGTNDREPELSLDNESKSVLKGEIVDMMDTGMDVQLDSGTVGDQKVQAGKSQLFRTTKEQTAKQTHATSMDKGGFSVTDLVWGKVKSHPWWPGQIFDPKDASEMALRHQKKDHLLVAYFGDKSFAWCEESRLKPFQTYFSELEKQSNMESFVNAVDDTLEEVSRRIELGMRCGCFADESYDCMKYLEVENAGIREGTCSSSVDRSLVVSSFQPDRLLEYIWDLGKCSSGGADKLELATSKAQLKAYYHSRGYPELPVFLIGGGLVEKDDEILLLDSGKSGEGNADNSLLVASDIVVEKKRPRGRPRKVKSILEEEDDHIANGDRGGVKVKSISRASGKKRRVADSDLGDTGKNKKKRLDSLGDSETQSPSLIRNRSSIIGECMRQVATQMKGSPPIIKSDSAMLQNSVSKRSHGKSELALEEYSSPSEMLSQLCLAARDPMKGYSFLSMIIAFFTDFRDSLSCNSSGDQKHVKSVGRKRGRKKKPTNSDSTSLDMCGADYMQDSYWTDIILHSSPERESASSGRKRRGRPKKKRQEKKAKSVEEPSQSSPSDYKLDASQGLLMGTSNANDELELAADRQRSNSTERIEECAPTALILSFNESDALPSEADLVKIFSRYGPLKEAETEVLRKTNRAKVVFKRRDDAEVAFSSAGKYSIFGPALVSYRLKYLQSSPKESQYAPPSDNKDLSPKESQDASPSENKDLSPKESQEVPPSDNKDAIDTEVGDLEHAAQDGSAITNGNT